MDKNQLYGVMEKVVKLENRINNRMKQPLNGLDMKAQEEDLHTLSEHMQILNKTSINDLIGYHKHVQKSITTLTREHEEIVKEYEAKLKQAELDKEFIGRYSAEMQ